jgi:hypothetical protein
MATATKVPRKKTCKGEPAVVYDVVDKVDYLVAEYCCEKHAFEAAKKGQHVAPA